MNWDMLVAHQWAVNMLREHIAQNRLRHAYLITGPEGVGKRTLALHLAQAVNCTNLLLLALSRVGSVCKLQAAGENAAPGLTIVQANRLAGRLRLDQVRELQHILSLSPFDARYRIALLLRFQEAHPSASNALLKTLEEPNPQVVLILTADSPETLLPTIVSRCEVVRLALLTLEITTQDCKLVGDKIRKSPPFGASLRRSPGGCAASQSTTRAA